MTAGTARRVAALRARAEHPGTPPAEALACREKLVLLSPPRWVSVLPGVRIDLANITVIRAS